MSEPGDWTWFPDSRLSWSLDIVTLLAVIGESSIANHAQFMTSSTFCLLPRLIPAPQALLKPSRQSRMPEISAKVAGVYNGLTLNSIGFFANIIHPLDSFPKYSFHVLHIQHSERAKKLTRRLTIAEQLQEFITSPTLLIRQGHPAIPPKILSPLHILSVLSFISTVGILIAAVFWRDGPAIIAVSLLAVTSTIAGYASLWRPVLAVRKHSNEVPRGDILIYTREAAFILIKCTEEVSRELYTATGQCDYYVGAQTYRLLMGTSTMALMVGVILLGNCTWNSQAFIGSTYILLNGLYWGLGMLPHSYFWDLSRYCCDDVTPLDAQNAHETTDATAGVEGQPSFTRTLWYAIRETKVFSWAERVEAAPKSEQWKQWLHEAQENATNNNRSWNAVERKNFYMKPKVLDPSTSHSLVQLAPTTIIEPKPIS